ncbi:MAG: hypothetical protein KDC71_23775 [Acidobacteria bacterium]|nr:hypothetical protein [Acidobacteriota bacterium]
MKKFLIGCGIVAVSGFVILFGTLMWLGFKMESGDAPDTKILLGSEIKAPTRKVIDQFIELAEDEAIIFYYSAGLFDHSENMNLVTDQRVIVYQGSDAPVIYCRYDNIKEIEYEVQGSTFEDSSLLLATRDGNPALFSLTLSAEEGRDERVFKYIQDRISE